MTPAHDLRAQPTDQDGAMAHLVARLSLGGAGPTVAVKDVVDIEGHPTRAGSRALDGAAPAHTHADVVEALLAAGCRIVGKTKMHELAFGVTGLNAWTGTPPNPRHPEHVPGGSSSGSASIVAAGLVDFAIGTDTGGSIRVPAACCGVVGLKPTFGRLSRRGLTPARSSLDCVGPLARTTVMLIKAMAILDGNFRPVAAADRPRLALVTTEATPEITAAVTAAVTDDGFDLRTATLSGLDQAFAAGMTIMNAEMVRDFGHLLSTGRLGADIARRLEAGRQISATDIAAAEAVRKTFGVAVDDALADVDALVLPTLPAAAVLLRDAGDAAAALRMTRLVRPFNLTGHPAISLPIPDAAATGPVSLQLVGRRGDDAHLCAIAGRLEANLRSLRHQQGEIRS